MDMGRFVRRMLNRAELMQMSGQYEGVIAEVVEEEVRNSYKRATEVVPMIRFEDGECVIPNIGMRKTLIDALGTDTEAYVGVRVMVYLDLVETKSGGTRHQKCLKVVPG